MRLTSIRRRRRRRRLWRQRPEILRRRWSVATPVGLHPSYVATDHRRFLTTNPGGTPLIIRGKLFRQPRPALPALKMLITIDPVAASARDRKPPVAKTAPVAIKLRRVKFFMRSSLLC